MAAQVTEYVDHLPLRSSCTTHLTAHALLWRPHFWSARASAPSCPALAMQVEQRAPRKDWAHAEFEWDAEVQGLLQGTFGLEAFRCAGGP